MHHGSCAIFQLLADPKCLASKLPGATAEVLIPKGLVVRVAGLKMIVVSYLGVARGHSALQPGRPTA